MSKQEEYTVVFTTDCVERCGVLPDMRTNEAGDIEVYIPGTTGTDEGEWVHAEAKEADGIVTLSCDATTDGFKAIYKTTPQRLYEAQQPETRHRKRIPGVPRQCGMCQDRLDNIRYTIYTTDDVVRIETDTQTYLFAHDSVYGTEHMTPEMVKIVINYVKQHAVSDTQNYSFFDMLKRGLQTSFSA